MTTPIGNNPNRPRIPGSDPISDRQPAQEVELQQPAQEPAKDEYEELSNKVSDAANQVKLGVDKQSVGRALRHGGDVPGTVGSRRAGAIGFATDAVQLPGALLTAQHDVRQALREATGENVNKAAGSVASLGSTAGGVLASGLETGAQYQQYRAGLSAARGALRAAAPGAGKEVLQAAATAAAEVAAAGGATRAVQTAARGAAIAAAKLEGAGMKAALGVATRAGAREALKEVGERSALAAGKAVARASASPLAKAAGRFAPGLNVAVAAFDTASAVTALRDQEASLSKKISACVTAAGSIVSATNIPILSQAGAVISTASSVVGALLE